MGNRRERGWTNDESWLRWYSRGNGSALPGGPPGQGRAIAPTIPPEPAFIVGPSTLTPIAHEFCPCSSETVSPETSSGGKVTSPLSRAAISSRRVSVRSAVRPRYLFVSLGPTRL